MAVVRRCESYRKPVARTEAIRKVPTAMGALKEQSPDAVSTTAETWDAETGSFTYDANGNVLSAGAPYSITAVTYDQHNLPLSLSRSGTTTGYRYDEAGQRIVKQVSGSGTAEFYVLEGATTLAVVTVDDSGTPLSWFFNALAGDRVIGREANTGGRRYYHTDLLNTTRAVVQGTTVLESYDFEPWGLLMPGRTLGSGTKEGFTGKERDAESGLDYFGARLYMPAFGRWTSVDPLADKHPEWSPYNYVLNNPLVLIDPDGRQVSANDPKPENPGAPGASAGAGAPDSRSQGSNPGGQDGWQAFLKGAKSLIGEAKAGLDDFMAAHGQELGIVLMDAANGTSGTASLGRGSQLSKATGAAARASGKLGGAAARSGAKASKIDRAAFRPERESYWKAEAKANPSQYTPENLERMQAGRAPKGADGHSVELHHKDRTPAGGVQPMTRTEHRLGENYRKNHP